MSPLPLRGMSLRGVVAGGAVLALVGVGLVVADPAAAATTITVTSTADDDANSACSTSSVVTTASPVTLRNALCVANNIGGESSITVPAGTYTLTDGPLVLGTGPGTDVTLTSVGGRAEIVGDGSSQILTLDPNLVGDVDIEIEGFGFTGGHDTVFGGGAIIGGSADGANPDTLVIRDSEFTDNTSTGGTANPGGAIQFMGGDLTIENSVFEGNSSGAASGGAVYFGAPGAGGDLEITGSTFRDNSVAQTSTIAVGGGAVAYDTGGTGTAAITDNVFIGNTASGGLASGGAIQQVRGPASISKNVFQGNTAGNAGSAVDAANGAFTAQFNSITSNAGIPSVRTAASTAATLTNNWWGCNGGPGTAGCDTATIATGTAAPFLLFTATTAAAAVDVAGTTTLSGSLRTNSAGDAIAGSDLSAFDGDTVTWTAAAPAGSSVSPSTSEIADGIATTTFTAGGAGGPGGATATYAGIAAPVVVDVRQQVSFTSADTATATVGAPFGFAITAVGYPAPTVQLSSGALPVGIAVSGTGSTLTLSGVPTQAGTFPLVFTASNGGTPVTQTLTLNIGQAPSFTGTLSATVADGDAVDAVISTSGVPAPGIEATGTLPAGLQLDDNGDGTARLHGTPTDGPGEYSIALTAENSIGTATGAFVLTVTADPAFTSADHTTFVVGEAGAFAITVDPGFPAYDVVTLTGQPAWLSLDGTAGTQSLVGTPPVGSGGVYDLTLTIDGTGITQAFSLTVHEAPVVTSQPASTSVLEGTDAVFSASVSGYPAPGVQWQRFTAGSWTDLDDETDTTLTIASPSIDDDGAPVRAVFTSAAGSVTSDEAVLTVGQLPTIDAVDPVTAPVGESLEIDVTTGGLPTGTLTAVDVPAWLIFTDAADGTATLTGTPALADAGEYTVTVTVDNGFGTADTEIDITVIGTLPQFTSPLDATVASGDEVYVALSATGTPTPAITISGALPAGLELDADDDGTARLHGTPTVAPGEYEIVLTASNVHGTDTETFTLTITAPPAFTNDDEATFTVGSAGSFAVTVDPGFPVKNSVSLVGAPTWLVLDGTPGAQSLIGTPPAGSGGTYDLELSIDETSVVQEFTLTVNEAPVVSAQPAPLTVLIGEDAEFTASSTGYPAPAVQWQRLIEGSWTDIEGATSNTLSFPASVADDGALFRAEFANAAGVTTSDEVALTVGQLPEIAGVEPIDVLAGAAVTVDLSSTGHPTSVLTAADVPAWLTFTPAADGTATLTGTPTLADAGEYEVVITATNPYGTAQTTIAIRVGDTVTLPILLPPTSDGSLTGVPASVTPGQQLTIGGTGFLPGAVVQLGIYSVPTSLGTAVADAGGAFSAVITIPADQSLGAHTVAAAGVGADGTARLLTAATTVIAPSTDDSGTGTGTGTGSGTGNGTGTAAGTGLAATGSDAAGVLALSLLGLLAALGGLVIARGARRRTV
ncbi:beta strand repeat-containing protein [Microbacterium sp. ZW T5_45]|uniref:beta strand repeat-containing protein n=1 Tax=Microbacterium sp. ZW T5_45 TaxID=3378080 RepID=UPI003853A7A8